MTSTYVIYHLMPNSQANSMCYENSAESLSAIILLLLGLIHYVLQSPDQLITFQ